MGTLALTGYDDPEALLYAAACFMLPAIVVGATVVVYLCAQFETSRVFFKNLIGFRSYRLYVGLNPGSRAVNGVVMGTTIVLGGATAAMLVFKGSDHLLNTATLQLEHKQIMETLKELRELETDLRKNSHLGGTLVQQTLENTDSAAQGSASGQQAASAAQVIADRAAFDRARAEQLSKLTDHLADQIINKSIERLPRHDTTGRLLDITEVAVKGYFDSRKER
jgi:hypothetical protein